LSRRATAPASSRWMGWKRCDRGWSA
jgi:hypothetical protein